MGTPPPSVRTLRLAPSFPRSVGFWPTFFPPRGALVMAPSIASHAQSIPFKASSATRPLFQSARQTPAAVHAWKRRWAELLEQRPVSCSAFHWQPVRSTKKMTSMAFRSSTRGRWQPRGCGWRGGSSGPRRSHNASGRRQSRRVFSSSSGIGEAPIGENFSLQDTLKLAYWDSLLVVYRDAPCEPSQTAPEWLANHLCRVEHPLNCARDGSSTTSHD